MKTKDNLLKGIIIGVCVVVVPLLTMGLSNNSNEGEVGTFQISTTNGGWDVFETIITSILLFNITSEMISTCESSISGETLTAIGILEFKF